ncbi:hypothetical protein C368_00386, partial [Cryptococcus neoformans 125.91]
RVARRKDEDRIAEA